MGRPIIRLPPPVHQLAPAGPRPSGTGRPGMRSPAGGRERVRGEFAGFLRERAQDTRVRLLNVVGVMRDPFPRGHAMDLTRSDLASALPDLDGTKRLPGLRAGADVWR